MKSNITFLLLTFSFAAILILSLAGVFLLDFKTAQFRDDAIIEQSKADGRQEILDRIKSNCELLGNTQGDKLYQCPEKFADN
ncbi:MAG: hypothetical protein M1455_07355 [Actinobacteria bacterium]|nr:hypothetical protein [Actinomycetota bacterium]